MLVEIGVFVFMAMINFQIAWILDQHIGFEFEQMTMIMFFIGLVQTIVSVPFGKVGLSIGSIGLLTMVISLMSSGYLENPFAQLSATICGLIILLLLYNKSTIYNSMVGNSSNALEHEE